MRISVALCVYNGERYLPEQLESIAGQVRKPDEIVICDDSSTDDSPKLVDHFAGRSHVPVRFYRNEANLGVTKNFERAIGLTSGDLIVTADQDDVWYSEKLARIASEFARSPEVGLVFSDADLIDEEGRMLGSRLWPSVRFSESSRRQLERDPFGVLIRRPVITGATMAFRSALRNLALPIGPRWLHDEWFGLMASAMSKIRAIDEPLMQYRRHENNQVGVIGVNPADRMWASLVRPREALLKRAEDFRELRESLCSRIGDRPDLIEQVEQKIIHFQARGSLPETRWKRIPTILRELASFRYSRYSGHSLSFARDFLSK